jgi:acyl carrier protein
MHDFYAKLSDTLEVDEINPADSLADFPEWDSLAALSVIAMVHSEYRITLTAAELKSAATAEALRNLVAGKAGQ